jgi:hypothetical protein
MEKPELTADFSMVQQLRTFVIGELSGWCGGGGW